MYKSGLEQSLRHGRRLNLRPFDDNFFSNSASSVSFRYAECFKWLTKYVMEKLAELGFFVLVLWVEVILFQEQPIIFAFASLWASVSMINQLDSVQHCTHHSRTAQKIPIHHATEDKNIPVAAHIWRLAKPDSVCSATSKDMWLPVFLWMQWIIWSKKV